MHVLTRLRSALRADGRPDFAPVTTATGPFAFEFDALGQVVLVDASGSANTYRVLPVRCAVRDRRAGRHRPGRKHAGSRERAAMSTRPTPPATRSPATQRHRTDSSTCCMPTASARRRTRARSISRPRPADARCSSSTDSRVISASTRSRLTARSPGSTRCMGFRPTTDQMAWRGSRSPERDTGRRDAVTHPLLMASSFLYLAFVSLLELMIRSGWTSGVKDTAVDCGALVVYSPSGSSWGRGSTGRGTVSTKGSEDG
jgi:hypothetical protein